MQKISQMVCISYLVILAVIDIRKKVLPVGLLAIGLGAAVFYRAVFALAPTGSGIAGGAAGILFLAVSRITREAIGYGDSILILILGIYLGIEELMILLSAAFFSAAVFAVSVLCVRRFRRKTVFPFVPFLGAGYLVELWIRGLG